MAELLNIHVGDGAARNDKLLMVSGANLEKLDF